jgi:hypothetical protein
MVLLGAVAGQAPRWPAPALRPCDVMGAFPTQRARNLRSLAPSGPPGLKALSITGAGAPPTQNEPAAPGRLGIGTGRAALAQLAFCAT